MRHLIIPIAILAQLIACSSDDNKSNNQVDTRCGAGQAVTADGQLACVYTNELIEEGFTCPTIVPTGFLLNGGGVACVAGEVMPPPLKDELIKGGHEPLEPGCFDTAPTETCFYQGTTQAFKLTGAGVITYQTSGGFGYCVGEGDILDFTFNLNTLAATVGVGAVGDESVDTCLTQLSGDCIIRSEQALQLTQPQADSLVALMNSVPAPMCVVNQGMVCDFCVIETLSVDSQTVDTNCCGQVAAGFGSSINDVVGFVKDLLPTTINAFANPTTFETLVYTTGPGFGYCVDDGMILRATIARSTVDQSLSISGFEAVLGDVATDSCIEDTIDGNCYVATPFGPLTLGQTEQDALELALAAVPAPMCIVDPGLACDPCIVTSIDLDGSVADNNCCGSSATEYDAAYASLIAAIEASR